MSTGTGVALLVVALVVGAAATAGLEALGVDGTTASFVGLGTMSATFLGLGWAGMALDAATGPPPAQQRRYVREPIPQRVKDQVWRRDGGACVECGSNERLEFDHIIPLAKGGANTYRNIQLLCEPCNRMKGARLGQLGPPRRRRPHRDVPARVSSC